MTLISLLITILGIGFLMFVHEGGHFVAARMTGMRVLKFSLGMGPVIWRKQAVGSTTVFQIALIPFLAYVQIAGMNPFEETDPNDEGLFGKKSALARSFVIAAGPLANYLLASLMMFGLYTLSGVDVPVENPRWVDIVVVQGGGAAAGAGMRVNDHILAVNGVPTRTPEDLIAQTRGRANQPTVYRIERQGRVREMTITPRLAEGVGRIGVVPVPQMHRQPLGVLEAGKMAVVRPAIMTYMQLEAIAEAVVQRTTRNFGGPVAMAEQSMEAVNKGAVYYLEFLAFVSVAIGFFNLLPFPALDGGRLLFLLFELVFRRRVDEKVEASVNAIGMATLLTFMVFITYKDIFHAAN